MRVDLRDSIWRDTQKARYHTTPHHFELPTHHTHKVATLTARSTRTKQPLWVILDSRFYSAQHPFTRSSTEKLSSSDDTFLRCEVRTTRILHPYKATFADQRQNNPPTTPAQQHRTNDCLNRSLYRGIPHGDTSHWILHTRDALSPYSELHSYYIKVVLHTFIYSTPLNWHSATDAWLILRQ